MSRSIHMSGLHAARERRGAALVLALMLVMGLVVMSAAFFHVTSGSARRQRASFDDRRAFFLAEAGLQEGYEALRQGGTGTVGSMAAPAYLDGGVFWVDATDLGNDTTSLVSTALVASGRYALQAVVKVDPDDTPLFEATLNSKDQLTLNADVLIDSFDSALGTYASQAVNTASGLTYAGSNGDVRSNKDIIANARAAVFGDATPGPSYNVSLSTEAFVTGSIAPASTGFDFPPIVFPSYPVGAALAVSGSGQIITSGDYEYPSITINKDATLRIVGPVNIVVDDFVGGKDANLEIDATNGPVTIYVRNSYTHTAGFEAAPALGSPMALAFLVDAAQDIVFPSNVNVRGAYYLPNANILFASSNECWGSFAANRIDMSNNMKFHFDEELSKHWDANTGQQGDDFEILAGNQMAVSPGSLLTDRRPPLQALQLQKSGLLTPWQSWEAPAGP